jgi:DNA-binding protein HU-beta
MSITKDIRSYADNAVEQGKQVLDQAQTQLHDVTGQANGLVGKVTGTAKDNVSGLTTKATDAVHDLRTQAEKAVNVDAIKAAVEPYVAQAKGYSTTVTDRAEELLTTVKNDKRVAKLVSTAEAVTGVVVETVQQRVVKPVQALTGRGSKPARKAPAAAKPATTKPATAKPASKPATTARKTTARKAPAKTAATKA